MATSESIRDILFKSRLTIKYRTEISGTPVEAKLPFRVLVLGDFSGKSSHLDGYSGDPLHRTVWSITKGTTPDHLLRMLGYSIKVTDDELKSHFPGTVRCGARFTRGDLKVPSGASGEMSRPVKVDSDTIKFASARAENGVTDISKCVAYLEATLRFSTSAGDIGDFLGVKLMLRGRVFGEQIDEATGKVVGAVSGRMKVDTDPEIALTGASPTWTGTIPDPGGGMVTVERSTTDPTQFTLSITDHKVNAERTIPILNMDSFTPDAVAQSIPGLSAVAATGNDTIQDLLGAVLLDEELRSVEASWRSFADLASCVDSDDVIVDLLDITKDELSEDCQENQTDIFGSALFKKVYIDEYDRYGGQPFSAMIGLYEMENTPEDMVWLETMAKIANASHCPFVASAAPTFFQPCKTIEEVAQTSDLETLMKHPRFAAWQALRDQPWAAYVGLTVPRYLIRKPWGAELMLLGTKEPGNAIELEEKVNVDANDKSKELLWGNAAVLFGKNLIRSYQNSGWAQNIRGPHGGGIVEGLPVFVYRNRDNGTDERNEIYPPLEIEIPDDRELQLSKCGFIALVHKRGEATATFFSAQSIKKPKDFVEELATQNAHLVTNLAYTFSITRIAHYVKRMMREYIGSTADAAYIQLTLSNWLRQYVTTVTNPDDLTLASYPFKAATVVVEPKPGPLGHYKATISIFPHAQFEGMDVELRLEAALGAA